MSFQTSFGDRLCQVLDSAPPAVVGVDPNLDYFPQEFLDERNYSTTMSRAEKAKIIESYCQELLGAVSDMVRIVKPQSAYFEQFGADGIAVLESVVDYARSLGMIVILDVKRGDIGATSEAYASAYLQDEDTNALLADAITLIPYLGTDSMEPFVQMHEKTGTGSFICCKTSNPGSNTLQNLEYNGGPLYLQVATMVRDLGTSTIGNSGYSSVGAVVGATYPQDAQYLRTLLPNTFFLVPGIGAQGGDTSLLPSFFNNDGKGALVNSSRGVMYPHRFDKESKPGQDWRSAITDAAARFATQVTQAAQQAKQ